MSSLIDMPYLVWNLLSQDFPCRVRVTGEIGDHCALINLDQVSNFSTIGKLARVEFASIRNLMKSSLRKHGEFYCDPNPRKCKQVFIII